MLSPVPEIPKNSIAHTEALRLIETYKAYLEPCEPVQVANQVIRLKAHYWQRDMSVEMMKVVAEDYEKVLTNYSYPMIKRAIDDWVITPTHFAPSLGELKEKLDELKAKTETKIKRLQVLLDNAK